MTAAEISKSLVATLFPLRPNFVCVQNVSHGFFPHWEADLLACTKAGYLTEIEIKVSMSDWRIDKEKVKFRGGQGVESWWRLVKNFYYAAPEGMAESWPEIGIPDWAGVISVQHRVCCDTMNGEYHPCNVIKSPIVREYRKLRPDEMLKLARLGSMRAWDRRAFDMTKPREEA